LHNWVNTGYIYAGCSCAVLQVHGGHTGLEGPGLSQQQKLGYAAAFVGLPYLWLRLQRHAAQQQWGQRQDDAVGLAAWKLLRGVDAAHKVGQLLNLWVFLYQGKYRWAQPVDNHCSLIRGCV
jgi:hypothetical protein